MLMVASPGFTHLATNAARFKCLNTVIIHGPLLLSNVIPLFLMPTLRSLELHQAITLPSQADRQLPWEASETDQYNLTPNSIALESLALKKSYLQTTALSMLLNSIKSLKSFTYEHVRHKLSHPRDMRLLVDYMHLADALARHSDTLATLRLHDKYDTWMTGLMYVLTRLHRLEELDIKLPHEAAQALIQTPSRPSAIEVDMWLEAYFPPASLHTLKLRSAVTARAFSRSFARHCRAPACKRFADDNALNSVTVLRALAKRGLKHVCLAFSVCDLPAPDCFLLTQGVFASAGLEFELVDYYD
ncbi:hypothetical protein DE146DRAFT_378665 [Phaeosphaeria sp. MPI-PUGE-AT-0046c]|nr:hypothetical protein DE146DRAFT_378665 [Phaeosphaeria sp. MPI-PUGE-AT-0046c]